MPGTVYEFRMMVFERTGVSQENYDEFIGDDMARIAFWEKLNRFGRCRIKQLPPEKVFDIDKTARLSETEWAELEHEFETLLKSA